jgi:hypothetical protein
MAGKSEKLTMDKAIQTPVATNPQATAGGAPIMVPGGILLLTADYVRLDRICCSPAGMASNTSFPAILPPRRQPI